MQDRKKPKGSKKKNEEDKQLAQSILDSLTLSDRDPSDPYSGFMTLQEKDLIARIHLSQLATENPYLDDFYYHSYSHKKSRTAVPKESLLASLYLPLPRVEVFKKKAKEPMLIPEGTLGKLPSHSVRNPRQMLDIKPEALRTSTKSSNVLSEIEALYDKVLFAEDFEIKRQENINYDP